MISLLPKIFPTNDDNRRAESERRLIRGEAEIGGKLFGPVPAGHKRQFFCLDEHTWIWYEEWSENGRQRTITTRYEIRSTGIFKSQDGQSTQPISKTEARNLYKAALIYYQRVQAAYQHVLAA